MGWERGAEAEHASAIDVRKEQGKQDGWGGSIGVGEVDLDSLLFGL